MLAHSICWRAPARVHLHHVESLDVGILLHVISQLVPLRDARPSHAHLALHPLHLRLALVVADTHVGARGCANARETAGLIERIGGDGHALGHRVPAAAVLVGSRAWTSKARTRVQHRPAH